ncbi:putative beta-glucosidase 23 [Platanthera guangdongensis]|uniref:Beta-glucosidase 23 n=1 Tax=Platanthera guangdongensis TaxID=2320717 RepID=A0ABR2MAI4_9ASPA
MTDAGIEAYRFSISWSRILPNGRGAVNPKGLIYYKNVINEIVKRGIRLHVNLHHLDLPQILQDEYGGWLSPNIVDDFKEYADICFKEFGDQVSHWTTIVEPNVYAVGGYDSGIFAPARCSYPFGRTNCTAGNSTTEPYIAVHNMLLAHAKVVNLYRTKYQNNQNGQIGMNFYSFWVYPTSNSSDDIEAAQRVFDFQFGWSGVNVKGYFAWSFIDIFEYLNGYKSSCGLYHVDFADELRLRTPKLSARWYSNFLKSDSKAVGIIERSDLQHMFRLSQ